MEQKALSGTSQAYAFSKRWVLINWIDVIGATENIRNAIHDNGGEFILQVKENCPELMGVFERLSEEGEWPGRIPGQIWGLLQRGQNQPHEVFERRELKTAQTGDSRRDRA